MFYDKSDKYGNLDEGMCRAGLGYAVSDSRFATSRMQRQRWQPPNHLSSTASDQPANQHKLTERGLRKFILWGASSFCWILYTDRKLTHEWRFLSTSRFLTSNPWNQQLRWSEVLGNSNFHIITKYINNKSFEFKHLIPCVSLLSVCLQWNAEHKDQRWTTLLPNQATFFQPSCKNLKMSIKYLTFVSENSN